MANRGQRPQEVLDRIAAEEAAVAEAEAAEIAARKAAAQTALQAAVLSAAHDVGAQPDAVPAVEAAGQSMVDDRYGATAERDAAQTAAQPDAVAAARAAVQSAVDGRFGATAEDECDSDSEETSSDSVVSHDDVEGESLGSDDSSSASDNE